MKRCTIATGLAAMLAGLAFPSCGVLKWGFKSEGTQVPDTPAAPRIAGGVPPKIATPGAASAAVGDARPIAITPEDEIIFTDPDNPDADIPELSAILENAPVRRGPWEESETIARKRSMREGKPLLIWFTDSRMSPMCKALAEELFNRPDFNEWAAEHLIRLKVDSNEQANDPSLSLDDKETRLAEIRGYVARLSRQYKVLGKPTLVMVHPDGRVVGRYRGYTRGQADFTWGLIKQGEASFRQSYSAWRTDLEKRGYREWSDRQGRKVFARLARYADGVLYLIEPDGTRSKTHEKRLSDGDRAWIDEQKRLRGL